MFSFSFQDNWEDLTKSRVFFCLFLFVRFLLGGAHLLRVSILYWKSILKEINPEYSLEGLLKLKLRYFGHVIAKNWLTDKDPDAGKDWGQEEKEVAEDEMVGWHHWLNGHEFEQTWGDSEGQESLACCSP